MLLYGIPKKSGRYPWNETDADLWTYLTESKFKDKLELALKYAIYNGLPDETIEEIVKEALDFYIRGVGK